MKKSFALFLIVLILGLQLVGCGAKPETVYVTGEEAERVAEKVDPIASNILAGIASSDYEMFAANFDEAMRKGIPADSFTNLIKQFEKLGAVESLELLNIEDQGKFYGLNYGVNYASSKMNMRVVVAKDNPELVSGLWFK